VRRQATAVCRILLFQPIHHQRSASLKTQNIS
jgi:hypothetical protein